MKHNQIEPWILIMTSFLWTSSIAEIPCGALRVQSEVPSQLSFNGKSPELVPTPWNAECIEPGSYTLELQPLDPRMRVTTHPFHIHDKEVIQLHSKSKAWMHPTLNPHLYSTEKWNTLSLQYQEQITLQWHWISSRYGLSAKIGQGTWQQQVHWKPISNLPFTWTLGTKNQWHRPLLGTKWHTGLQIEQIYQNWWAHGQFEIHSHSDQVGPPWVLQGPMIHASTSFFKRWNHVNPEISLHGKALSQFRDQELQLYTPIVYGTVGVHVMLSSRISIHALASTPGWHKQNWETNFAIHWNPKTQVHLQKRNLKSTQNTYWFAAKQLDSLTWTQSQIHLQQTQYRMLSLEKWQRQLKQSPIPKDQGCHYSTGIWLEQDSLHPHMAIRTGLDLGEGRLCARHPDDWQYIPLNSTEKANLRLWIPFTLDSTGQLSILEPHPTRGGAVW